MRHHDKSDTSVASEGWIPLFHHEKNTIQEPGEHNMFLTHKFGAKMLAQLWPKLYQL